MQFPYIEVHDQKIGPVPLHPFGALVSVGVIVGMFLSVRRAERAGLDRHKIEWFVTWSLVSGFVLSHVLDVLMYRPQTILDHPIELLLLNHGISSFGGFVGGVLGGLVWARIKKERFLTYADHVAAVFPIAWIFGRAGCAVAHDHIGRLTTSALLGVTFPASGPFPPGNRFDLGLLELFATIPIALATHLYARDERPAGSILAFVALSYAPVRFALDSLRGTDFQGADARYLHLTPGQWGAAALLLVGIALLVRARREEASSTTSPSP